MAAVDINGTPLACFEDGSGAPVLLVHGSASDYRTWQAQRCDFAERFRVVTYSRRYHWPNGEIPEDADYSMTGHVDDLQALVESLDAGPVHLVGHSYGAFLCLLLAVRKPALARSLVLAEPPVVTLFAGIPPRPGEILGLLVRSPRTAFAIMKFGARGVAPAVRALRRGDTQAGVRAFGHAVFGTVGYQSLSELRKAQVQANLSNIRAELLGPGLADLDADQVRGIRAPVLLVSGEKSIALFHRLTDALERLLPRAERAEIPGASHAMHEDRPSEYNAAVLSFLARHQAV